MPRSSFVAYFDESGDHGLTNIDPAFPVFVLCGCVFRIAEYVGQDLGIFSSIKFKYFHHDAVVFHSRDIRKQTGAFQILTNAPTRTQFMADIGGYFAQSSLVIIAAGIDKAALVRRYRHPNNPYSMSLLFCLERLYGHLRDNNEAGYDLTCVFEKRGASEDAQLAAEFAKICSGHNQWGPLPFKIVFADKQTNMPGLQIADLAAYPIARQIMAPNAANPSYAAIYPRFRRSPAGIVTGWGLKIFP